MRQPIRAGGDSPLPTTTSIRQRRRSPDRMPELRTAFVNADLEVVRAVFRRDNRIARVLDIDPAQLSRWGRGQIPAPENQAMLHALAETVRLLAEGFEPAVIPGWFLAPRAGEERSPAELLCEGRYAELRETVEASLQGAFS